MKHIIKISTFATFPQPFMTNEDRVYRKPGKFLLFQIGARLITNCGSFGYNRLKQVFYKSVHIYKKLQQLWAKYSKSVQNIFVWFHFKLIMGFKSTSLF